MLEFGHLYVRFYREGAPVLKEDGSIYEIESPYTDSELSAISYTQSGRALSCLSY